MKVAAAILAAAAAGLVALVGVAAVSARPVLFLGAGLAVFLTAAAAGAALATRGRPRQPRRQRVVALAVGTLAGVAVFTVTALLPTGDARLPPPPVGGQRFWRLPTGSRIAYVRVPARATPRRTPVVFLHGGPGVADMAGDAATSGSSPATATTSGSTTRSAPAARPGSGTLGSTPSPATSPTWRPSASASAPTGWC